eukprot:TRINITY_DN1998_c0_g1_i2.p1 TRINITY_DN1998_c0_g1~~TRINITY_DN1998_c0_g1_i2.p1  ORF type:complete len:294 (+),score=55.93 TRINITY_DN1998_c0_g1_i2:127-882(+)
MELVFVLLVFVEKGAHASFLRCAIKKGFVHVHQAPAEVLASLVQPQNNVFLVFVSALPDLVAAIALFCSTPKICLNGTCACPAGVCGGECGCPSPQQCINQTCQCPKGTCGGSCCTSTQICLNSSCVAGVNMNVSMTLSPSASLKENDVLNLNISAGNSGNQQATGVSLDLTLPSFLNLTSVSSGSCNSTEKQKYSCQFKKMNFGAGVVQSLQIATVAKKKGEGSILAIVKSEQQDLNDGDNQISIAIQVK